MFNPKKSFFELPVVRWAIGIHVAIASASALAILITGDYGFSPTADGFNNFLHDFKFPIGVLAMLIPVVALLATNHRSEQTREQIRVAESQNKFINYFKHFEEFEKLASKFKFDDFDVKSFYKFVFPFSIEGGFHIAGNAFRDFTGVCESLVKASEKYLDDDDEYDISMLKDSIAIAIESIHELYYLVLNEKDYPNYNPRQDGDRNLYDMRIDLFILKDLIRMLDELMQFDTNYVMPDDVYDALDVDIMRIMEKAEGETDAV